MAWPVNKKVVSSYSTWVSVFQDVHAGLTGHSLLPIDVNVCADGRSLLKQSQDRGIGCVLLFHLMAMDLLELLHTWPLKWG